MCSVTGALARFTLDTVSTASEPTGKSTGNWATTIPGVTADNGTGTPFTSTCVPTMRVGSGDAVDSSDDPLVSLSPEMCTIAPGANTSLPPPGVVTPAAVTAGAGEPGPERGVASTSISPVNHNRAFSSMVRNGGRRQLSSKWP